MMDKKLENNGSKYDKNQIFFVSLRPEGIRYGKI